jgi:hypothetical protein
MDTATGPPWSQSDEGPGRPGWGPHERGAVLESETCVDAFALFQDPEGKTIGALRPDTTS